MFLIFLRDDKRPEAKLRLQLNNLHMLGEFLLSLHLSEILIVFILVLGVGDFDHVLVEQPQELRPFHGLFDLFEILARHVVQLDVRFFWRWSIHC